MANYAQNVIADLYFINGVTRFMGLFSKAFGCLY